MGIKYECNSCPLVMTGCWREGQWRTIAGGIILGKGRFLASLKKPYMRQALQAVLGPIVQGLQLVSDICISSSQTCQLVPECKARLP